MTTRRSIVLGLAGVPLFGGLSVVCGCDSAGEGPPPPTTAEERNARLKESADYMRQQVESERKTKKRRR